MRKIDGDRVNILLWLLGILGFGRNPGGGRNVGMGKDIICIS